MHVFLKLAVVALWLCFHPKSNVNSDRNSHRRANGRTRNKRVVGGRILPSHDIYDTQYFIAMMETWSCSTGQSHLVAEDCQFKRHKCGGALIHPSFVLTACHCLSYSIYYKWEYERPLPHVPDLRPEDVPSFLAPDWDWGFPPGLTIGLSTITKPLHPLYNAMTLFAGHANVSKSTQKRHAAAFYPHNHCVHYQIQKYPQTWNMSDHFEFDVGLVKSCEPFKPDKNVRLAPILPVADLKSQLDDLLRKSSVCLFAGWGQMPPEGRLIRMSAELQQVDTLHHHWRYVQCSKSCHSLNFYCVLCSFHHGPDIAHNSVGDSGSPITCNGYVAGVISRGAKYYNLNLTAMMDFPIACVADYLKSSHLKWLSELDSEIFHWLNGKPAKLES